MDMAAYVLLIGIGLLFLFIVKMLRSANTEYFVIYEDWMACVTNGKLFSLEPANTK